MQKGFQYIAGIDEAGRGPLAGPLVAAAVILHPSIKQAPSINLVRDSKALSERQREQAKKIIEMHAQSIGIGISYTEFIDLYGIMPATRSAMNEAVRKLSIKPDFLLVDAVNLKDNPLPSSSFIKGDSTCLSIAAASIIAKTTRDNIMRSIDKVYPLYGFSQHKGYGTQKHLTILKQLGPTPVHRKSFAPVKIVSSSTV
jgi:ribonuclease HII